jgi:DNA primase large subunit
LQYGSDDLAKYTFLPQAGDFIRLQGVSISDLASQDYKKVVLRAEERVRQSIKDNKGISPKIEEREIEILSFPVALMLVKSTKLDHLMVRYALAESLRVETLLKQEKNPKVIEELFRTSLGIELEHVIQGTLPEFRIPIQEFVKRAAQFHRDEWRLVNKIVGGGKVFLAQDDLIRLIREEIRSMILQRLRDIKVPKLPESLEQVVKKIIAIAPPPPRSPYEQINVDPENYPPCVRHALDLLEKGENVPHYGRFLMATYLLAVGKTVDDIVALFPKSPDFKQSVTRYQVEHLAGLKGGRTRYRVPSCSTLLTHNFCFKDPVKCYGISSPLQYPSKKAPTGSPGPIGGEKRERDSFRAQESKQGRRKRDWTRTRH